MIAVFERRLLYFTVFPLSVRPPEKTILTLSISNISFSRTSEMDKGTCGEKERNWSDDYFRVIASARIDEAKDLNTSFLLINEETPA